MTADLKTLLAELEYLRIENDTLKKALDPIDTTQSIDPKVRLPTPEGLLAYSIDRTNDLIYWVNAEAQIVYANQTVTRALGYPQSELYQMRMDELYQTPQPEQWPNFWSDLKNLRSLTSEQVLRSKYGEPIPVEISANLISYNELDFCCTIVRLTGERKKAEEKIRHEQEYRNALWQANPDLMLLMNNRGVLLDTRGGSLFINRSHEELIGCSLFELDLPEDVIMLLHSANKAAIATGDPQTNEFSLKVAGILHHYESRAVKCGPNKVVVIVRNITEQKNNREKIRSQQAQQEAIIHVIPDNIYIMSEDGVYLDYWGGNGAVFIPPNEIIGSNIRDSAIPETVKNTILEANKRAIDSDQVQIIEYSLRFPDNVLRYFESRSVRYGPKQALRIVREITNRKQDELERDRLTQELRRLNEELMLSQVELQDSLSVALALKKEVEQTEQVYRDLVENSPDYIMRIGSDYRIEFLHSPHDTNTARFVGRLVRDEFDPETWLAIEQALDQVFSSGQPAHFAITTFVNSVGRDISFQSYCSSIRDLDQNIIAAYLVSRDVTASRKAAQEIETTKRNLQTTIDNGIQSIVLLDRAGRVVLADQKINNIFRDFYNLRIEKGELYSEYLLDPELREGFLVHFQKALRGEAIRTERQAFGLAKQNIWLDITFAPVLDESQNVIGVVLGQIDITARKEAEERLKKINEELVDQNNRLNHYSYVVSHNLRAPVASLIGLSNLFAMEGYITPENQTLANLISDAAANLDTVLRDLSHILNETRAIEEQKTQIDLQGETQIVTTLLDMDIKRSKAKVTTDFAKAPTLYSVKGLIHSVLLNLMTNAIKYRRAEVSLSIHIESWVQDGFVCLSFSDNGMGIDLENQRENLFKLYKRFHNHVDGKGIGLYLVKTQVEMLGGKIEVDSTLNEGTTFRILLKTSDPIL
jgi:PAS domain S-box-containing protein